MAISSHNLDTLAGVVFAGNPIEITATSDVSDAASMLRIVCEIEEYADNAMVRSQKMCYPLSRNDRTARFNVAEAIFRIMEYGEEYVVSDKYVSKRHGDNTFRIVLYDENFVNGKIHTSNIKMTSERVRAIAGGFSDYVLNKMADNAVVPMKLSRKPTSEKEHICKGFYHQYSSLIISADYKWSIEHHRERAVTTNASLCVIDYNPMMHHPIIFRNSFGELESCLAWCRQKIDVKQSQDVYITSRAAYDGQRTQIVDSYGDETRIALSTGGISPMWAQWWTFEPLRSRRAWIWMPTDLTTAAGCWVPCILRADNNTILDRSKGASEINFTAVLDWQGGLL